MSAWDPFQEKAQAESVNIAGVEFRRGGRVRLHPRKSADIFDLVLRGELAIIESIEQDFEGQFHLAVILDRDPGRELGEMRQPGHRFFFTPEELELLPAEQKEEVSASGESDN